MGFLSKIKSGLSKTRSSITNEVKSIFGVGKLTEEMLDELEEQLIRADIGVETSFKLVDELRERALGQPLSEKEALEMLADISAGLMLDTPEMVHEKPLHVIIIIGVNGAGKTTTIGKLAHKYKEQGKKVLVAAGDTFRAAAIEQLETWAERSGADLVKHQEGSDSAAVAYDAYAAAKSRGSDILLIDTAGRLHNKGHLMEELKKIIRILRKHDEALPHESILVIDGNTGQNTINQIKSFNNAVPLTSLVVTKLDGTAKGGSVISMSNELQLPIQWLGLGEKIDDLIPFSKEEFLKGLFDIDD